MDEVLQQLSLLNTNIVDISKQLDTINEKHVITDEKIANIERKITDIEGKFELRISSLESNDNIRGQSNISLRRKDQRVGPVAYVDTRKDFERRFSREKQHHAIASSANTGYESESNEIIEFRGAVEGLVHKGESIMAYRGIEFTGIKTLGTMFYTVLFQKNSE